MPHFDSSQPIVTRGSRAPPHHTLPTFINLNGIKLRLNLDHLQRLVKES